MRILVAACLLFVGAGRTSAQQGPTQFRLDLEAVAAKIVERLAPEPGEGVLLVGAPGHLDELVPHLRYAVVRAGGTDLSRLEVLAEPVPEAWDLALLLRGRAASREAYRRLLRDVTASVMLPGASVPHPAYAALQDLLAEGGSRRTIHFHWLQGRSAFPLPGQPLPGDAAIEAVYERALLETDYAALADAQARFEEKMRNATVRVTTPAGTDIRFRIGDRPVTKQDGDASPARARRARNLIDREIELPAGALRVAPVEKTVEGVIVFPPSQWNGRPVERLRLRFEGGRVVEIEAESGRDDAVAELDAGGDGARSFREFALGFSPLLAIPERAPWVPYYGYGAGVVRLSLGDNTELGGAVSGGYVRWNFFPDATVSLGDDVVVQNGHLR